jgi:FHS family Na+ dependent glucose MFS transporter 1
MTAALLLMATTLFLAPLTPWLWLLAAVLLLLGVAEGILDVGGNALLVWVHRHKVGPYMNGLHFFFGVGAFLSPILIAQAVLASGGIVWAYWSLALLILPAALWLARLPSPTAPAPMKRGAAGQTNLLLTGLIVLFLLLYVGAEISFGGWVYTYAVTLNLADKTVAAYLTSLFWGALTLGRLAAIPLAARFRPRAILLADLAGCLASTGIILFWPRSPIALWIGAFGLGFAMASIFPTVISWAERRMTLSGQVTSWFFAGVSLGSMSFPWLIGQLFDALGPRVTMYTILAGLAAASAVFAILMAYGGPPKLVEEETG